MRSLDFFFYLNFLEFIYIFIYFFWGEEGFKGFKVLLYHIYRYIYIGMIEAPLSLKKKKSYIVRYIENTLLYFSDLHIFFISLSLLSFVLIKKKKKFFFCYLLRF